MAARDDLAGVRRLIRTRAACRSAALINPPAPQAADADGWLPHPASGESGLPEEKILDVEGLADDSAPERHRRPPRSDQQTPEKPASGEGGPSRHGEPGLA